MSPKNLIRSILNFLHLDLTKNLEYDRLTKAIMKKVIRENSNCIDVGCHKGEILKYILKLSSNGKHYAFEPLPQFYSYLSGHFKTKVNIFPYALSDKSRSSSFQFVKNAPAYSGINKRKYDKPADIQEIKVELKKLDEVIPDDLKIDFIKIDVEGGEFAVLKGAKQLLKKNKPVVIFECGLGASDYYGTKPDELYTFLTEDVGLKISLLISYTENANSLSGREFVDHYNNKKEYYFIAHN